jgi:hypothetical protein
MRRRVRSWLRLLAAVWLLMLVFAVVGAAPSDAACGAPCADDCAVGCTDSGCVPTAHHCGCCGAFVAAATTEPRMVIPRRGVLAQTHRHVAARGPTRSDPPDTRPPIA